MPPGVTGLPIGSHPGAFGVVRRNHIHEGVDLYTEEGCPVLAVEEGLVVGVMPFTGPGAGLPWWRDTKAVLVEGRSGVVAYGEVSPLVSCGDRVQPGEVVARVVRVLRQDKGRPTSMLHIELHEPGARQCPAWLSSDTRPHTLRDPTPYLLEASHRLYRLPRKS
ncbi:peptidoglycan DD-metalloendopeptidase family protein [Variovorax sp. WDL1]